MIGFGTLYWTYTRNLKEGPGPEASQQRNKPIFPDSTDSRLEALEKEAQNTSGKFWDLGPGKKSSRDP